MNNAEIQILQMSPDGQTAIGNWSTVQIVEQQTLNIQNAMNQPQRQYPNCRVRAIDQASGRVLDILS